MHIEKPNSTLGRGESYEPQGLELLWVIQISLFWTLPHQPGHTGKICSAVRADHQIERVRADRNVSFAFGQ